MNHSLFRTHSPAGKRNYKQQMDLKGRAVGSFFCRVAGQCIPPQREYSLSYNGLPKANKSAQFGYIQKTVAPKFNSNEMRQIMPPPGKRILIHTWGKCSFINALSRTRCKQNPKLLSNWSRVMYNSRIWPMHIHPGISPPI